MFNFFATIFGYLLNIIYNFVNNYGIAIIIFTVVLKLVMLPISIKQQKTMKKSAKMQVKVKEIQEKYANDQLRQSQEMMDLYKKENMSPFSGCLTTIIQFIIILSMFYLVSRPLTYMKQINPETINSYATQVEEESGTRANYREIAIIKYMSDKDIDDNLKINMNFLGLDLSDIPSQNYSNWKVFIIPVLYVMTSILSTKLTMKMNEKQKEEKSDKEETNVEDKPEKPTTAEEDAMAEMNKQMALMTPIMTVSIALIAPLGLALYWLVSNILMIGERLVINKYFKEEEENDG